MHTTTKRSNLRPTIAFAMLALPLAACGGERGDDPGVIDETSRAWAFTRSPSGLDCGIAYKVGGPVVDGACLGVNTLSGTAAPDFHLANDGDNGNSSGNGFYHQALTFAQGGLNPNFPDWSQ